MGIPVWFDWNGEVVRMFAGKDTPKVHRLRRDPKASVLVTNHIDEPERGVAFDGLVSISDTGLDERALPQSRRGLQNATRRNCTERIGSEAA